MTNNLKRKAGLAVLLTIVIAACFALFMLTACGGEDLGTIELDKEAITLYIGADETLTASTSKEGATVTWESSNKDVATVSSKGKVTAKSAGTATVTASLSDTVKATCTVTVNEDTRTVSITGAPEGAIDVQTTTSLKLTGTASDNSKVVWSCNNSEVATVDSEGNVTFYKSATRSAEVTFTAKIDGGSASSSVTITVNNNYPEDYAVLEKNSTKANLIDDPDKWTYFIKSAHAGRLENTDRYCGGNVPYVAGGAYTFEFATAESGPEDDTTQYEFRYQPGSKVGLVKGDVYTLKFTITSTVSGSVHVVNGGAGRFTDLEYKDGVNYEGEYNFEMEAGTMEVTVEGCVVDDLSDPLAIRPFMFGDNVVVSVSNVTFTKTGHIDSIGGGEEANPDSYTLKKANNAAGAAGYKGQWSYYLSQAGVAAGCALKEGTYDGDTKTVSVTYTEFSENNVRLYYMPDEAEGTEIKVTFSIAMNVDGTIAFGEAASGNDGLTLEAGVAQEVELTLTVGASAILLTPKVTNEDDIGEVTFTISDFTVTAQ